MVKSSKSKHAIEHELVVHMREGIGTQRVKHLRHEGLIPAVVYGKKIDPKAIAVNSREFIKLLHVKAGGEHALVNLKINEGKSWERPALVKVVQHHPVDGHILHIDFQAIALTDKVHVTVTVVLKGEPVGVKQEGGVLEHMLREVEVECLPTDIPEQIEIDMSDLKLGDTLHVRDLPEKTGVKVLTDAEGMIAAVHAPREEKVAEEEEAAAEPEVIGEKKEEGEAAEGSPKTEESGGSEG